MRVLLVEDNPGDAFLIRQMITEGIGPATEMECVERLSDGLAYLQTNEADLVLLDLSLPDCEGLDSLHRVNKHAPMLPVVILSGLNDEELAAEAIRRGAQDYLVKGQVDGGLVRRSARYAIERKQGEVRLTEKTLELEEANARLQEVDRLKSVFLASVSHELRTPLNSIIGFSTVILDGMSGAINEEQRSQLAIVQRNADHLLSLINDILDISRIEAGQADVVLADFRLCDVVTEVIDAAMPGIERHVRLAHNVPQGTVIRSDRRRLKQVLTNLVGNAIKFTTQGSIRIEASAQHGHLLEISVIDTGIGIRDEDLARLFKPFQQINSSATRKTEGTGLGLHLCKKLVTLLGGEIWVRSEHGRGSEFTFTLPVRHTREREHEESACGGGQRGQPAPVPPPPPEERVRSHRGA